VLCAATVTDLPNQIRVLERGWLSSNNILLLDGEHATLVDSGYVAHAAQTVALVRHALAGRRLSRLVNTHSHSDHIGGNAALAAAFGCRIAIPEGIVPAVTEWDEAALLLEPTAQSATRFAHDDEVAAGDELGMGGLAWQALAAPGHDMHALVFYNPEKRILISGDALWRDGFGVIFAELMGTAEGLKAARETLDHLSRLAIDVVIPGHGAPFGDVEQALARAYARLAAFEVDSGRVHLLAAGAAADRRCRTAGVPGRGIAVP
jgi:glyoxylase-like metal-dependent hydrolase (beta-lactamase superfamily II)